MIVLLGRVWRWFFRPVTVMVMTLLLVLTNASLMFVNFRLLSEARRLTDLLPPVCRPGTILHKGDACILRMPESARVEKGNGI